MLVPSIIDAKYNPAKMQNPLAIPRFVESSTPKITHSILRRPTIYYSSEHRGARVPFGRFYRVFYWALHRVCMGVCTENSVLID